MQADEIKEKIKAILGEIEFEGHFDLVINNMEEKMQLHLLEWVKKCHDREIYPDPSPIDHSLLAFFFKPNVNNI